MGVRWLFPVCLRHAALAARLTMKGENMTQLKSSQSTHAPSTRATIGRLFVLDASGNRVFSVNPDGSDRKVIVTECRMPDGIAVDVEGGHIYWTNMGVPILNDGSIERADLDGRNRKTIVPQGRHVHAETAPDRQEKRQAVLVRPRGMRVMRANLDGSNVETLVDSSRSDPDRAAIRRRCASASPSMLTAASLLDAKRRG